MKGAHSSQRNIIHRIRRTCDKYNIHFSDYICDSLYMNKIKHNIKKYQEKNGIADSVSFILRNACSQSISMINALLSPF